jgi:hypothetical protein
VKAGCLLVVLCCSFSLLAGCAPNSDVLAATTDPSLPRNLTCLVRGADGACTKKICTSTSGGMTGDCASYAEACVSAAFTWTGGSVDGICSKP